MNALLKLALTIGVGFGVYSYLRHRSIKAYQGVMDRWYEDQWTKGPEPKE